MIRITQYSPTISFIRIRVEGETPENGLACIDYGIDLDEADQSRLGKDGLIRYQIRSCIRKLRAFIREATTSRITNVTITITHPQSEAPS